MNIDMILAASKRLNGHARQTPLLSSPFLDDIAGRRVFVKPECLQHTGSFKFRGAWSAISALTRKEIDKGIIAYSSGNHAQGVALAACEHGASCVIVMPSDAPKLKIENTRTLGAEIVFYDRATEDRDKIGTELADARGLTLIKPFDNEFVIAGQGTMGLEIAAQTKELGISPDTVLIPCGGGGLTSGIALALADRAPGTKIHPVEPLGFDDVTRSLISGRIEQNDKTTGSICDAIITAKPGDITFPILKELCSPGIVVPDDDCLHAMAQAFNRLKLVVEPGAAIALAAALFHGNQFTGDTIVAVISGGNVDPDQFKLALDAYGE